MRLHDVLYDYRTTSVEKSPAREMFLILVSVSNLGDIATCIEDVKLYWQHKDILSEERQGLAFFKKDPGQKKTLAKWRRADARYLECDSSQVIKPGRVLGLVAPMLFHLPPEFPTIDHLRAGKQERVELPKPMLLELMPVVGAPIAVEVPYVRGATISSYTS